MILCRYPTNVFRLMSRATSASDLICFIVIAMMLSFSTPLSAGAGDQGVPPILAQQAETEGPQKNTGADGKTTAVKDFAADVIHVYQAYAYHLNVIYGILAGLLTVGASIAVWFGFREVGKVRTDLRSAVDEIKKANDAEHQSATLRGMAIQCNFLTSVIDLIKSMPTDPANSEGRRQVHKLSENLMETAMQGASRAEASWKSKDSNTRADNLDMLNHWMSFWLYQGSAYARLGLYQDAVEKCRQVLATADITDKLNARANYNLACYLCQGNLASPADTIKPLRSAIYANLAYKATAARDPQLESLKRNPEFDELIS